MIDLSWMPSRNPSRYGIAALFARKASFLSLPVNRLCVYAMLIVMSAASMLVHADEVHNSSLNGDGISGIVADQTITLLGRDFYTGFSRVWRERMEDSDADLSISERPSARWGSLIVIEYRGNVVYRAFLFPGRADAETVGEAAAHAVAARVEQEQLDQLLFKDPDLAVGEL